MRRGFSRLLRLSGATLCVALTLVFTQATVASAVGDIEHLFVGHEEHQHVLFSDITLDFADHESAVSHHDKDGDTAPGHAPGHHHNPNDLGSSSFLIAATPLFPPIQVGMTVAPVTGAYVTKVRLSLMERPPRIGDIRL